MIIRVHVYLKKAYLSIFCGRPLLSRIILHCNAGISKLLGLPHTHLTADQAWPQNMDKYSFDIRFFELYIFFFSNLNVVGFKSIFFWFHILSLLSIQSTLYVILINCMYSLFVIMYSSIFDVRC